MENVEPRSVGSCTKLPETKDSLGKGGPPPFVLVLTLEANLISLQRELKCVVKGEFFRITTKIMMNHNVTQKFFTEKNLYFFTFYIKAFAWKYFFRGHHCGPPGDRLQRHLCKTNDHPT
jgi:hypothetical protein